MITSICSFKGGVGKTTTSIHLAAVLNKKAKTILVDSDDNESAIAWAQRGNLPFPIIKETALKEYANKFKHIVLDTAARPNPEELKVISSSSNLLVIPTQPDALSLDALIKIVFALREIKAANYKILLTLVPPRSNAGKEAKELFKALNIPYFKTEIRRRAVCSRAALKGVTVNDLKEGEEAWNDFQMLSKEILKHEN